MFEQMTRTVLIRKIRSLHTARAALNITAVMRTHPELIQAAYSFSPFLGWKQALEQAGLNYCDIRIELDDKVDCLICGRQFERAHKHVKASHQCSKEEYQKQFPGAYLTCEVIRANQLRVGRRKDPHWEPVLSIEYVYDRVWYYYQIYGQCNYQFIRTRDLSISGFVQSCKISWDEIIKKLGLQPSLERLTIYHERMDRDEIIRQLLERKRKGLSLRSSAIQLENPTLKASILDAFPGLQDAILAAGLEVDTDPTDTYSNVERIFPTREMVVEALKQRSASGASLRFHVIKREAPVLAMRIIHLFNDHHDCLRYARLWRAYRLEVACPSGEGTVEAVGSKAKYPTKESIIAALQERHRQGKELSSTLLKKEDNRLRTRAYSIFGTWPKAIEAAGLQDPHLKNLSVKQGKNIHSDRSIYPTSESVLEAVRQHVATGRSLRNSAVYLFNPPLRWAVRRHFFSWRVAVEAAGCQEDYILYKKNTKGPNNPKYRTADAVAAAILQRHKNGESLAYTHVKAADSALLVTAVKFYGSWAEAKSLVQSQDDK